MTLFLISVTLLFYLIREKIAPSPPETPSRLCLRSEGMKTTTEYQTETDGDANAS